MRGQLQITAVSPGFFYLNLKCCNILKSATQLGDDAACTSKLLVLVTLQVIPQLQGDATDQTPPDLPSYLFKERIVYLVSLFEMLCSQFASSTRCTPH